MDLSPLAPGTAPVTFTVEYTVASASSLHATDSVPLDPVRSRTVFTDSEPDRGHEWLVQKDDPSDPALFSVELTVAADEDVIANGDRRSDAVVPEGRRVAYAIDVPIASRACASAWRPRNASTGSRPAREPRPRSPMPVPRPESTAGRPRSWRGSAGGPRLPAEGRGVARRRLVREAPGDLRYATRRRTCAARRRRERRGPPGAPARHPRCPMVLAGQFLERPALIPCGELVLEGLYHRGGRAPALLLCPPVEESGMDAPPLAELAWAAARAGHASLRFQHRGRGASGGEPDVAQALADAEAALDHLAESAPGPLAVCGLWSGCATALTLLRHRPGLRGAVLLAPAALPASEPMERRILVLLPEEGAALDEAALRAALPGAEVQWLAGADARFQAGLPQAARRAVAFLAGSGAP